MVLELEPDHRILHGVGMLGVEEEPMKKRNALAKALELRRKAGAAISAAMKARYGEGAPISWDRHGIHSGSVVMLGHYDRVKVRNERTGKEFWIYANAILDS